MAKQKIFTDEDDALLAELGIEVEAKSAVVRTAQQERIIAGFEEIQRFVQTHERAPVLADDRGIFERLYAIRLDALRQQKEAVQLLKPLDHQSLLESGELVLEAQALDGLDDDALLALLEDDSKNASSYVPGHAVDITQLRHVRSQSEIRVADEIAKREPCEDFDDFKPLLDQVHDDIQAGIRKTLPFGKDASIELGNFFVLSGQLAYVAELGEWFKAPNGDSDARLRVIFSNGTQSNLLLRSLQRALYKDEAGRRVTDADAGPLFNDALREGDIESGTIYVLRSLSKHPFINEHRQLIHKIGVTGATVNKRTTNASKDATYLLADVEVVASYSLANINRTKLEKLLHRAFAAAQLDLTLHDRFDLPIKPREWFLVPLEAIDKAIEMIQDGTIDQFIYRPEQAGFAKA